MEKQTYRVVFEGEVIQNMDKEQVKHNMAALFKVDVPKILHLFSGKKFVLKESTDIDTVRKYVAQFQKITGAKCIITRTGMDTNSVGESNPVTEQLSPEQGQKSEAGQRTFDHFYETRYRVIFRGEITPGKNMNDIMSNMSSFYNVEQERLQHLFTGKRIIIKDSTDFWTATTSLKKFKEIGTICHLEPIDPPDTKTSSPPKPSETGISSANSTSDQTANPSEKDRIKSLSDKLYKNLTDTYKGIQQEYRIAEKSKKAENSDSATGCLIVLSIIALIGLVNVTPLRWYMGLLGFVGSVLIFISFEKTWNTEYVDLFLWKMRNEKYNNLPLFIVTLKKWINDLDKSDKAKGYLLISADKIVAEMGKQENYDKYSRIICSVKSDSLTVKSDKSDSLKPKNANSCPICGSNHVISKEERGFSWGKGIAASLFLGPLGGVIAGTAGKKYSAKICKKCNHEWS